MNGNNATNLSLTVTRPGPGKVNEPKQGIRYFDGTPPRAEIDLNVFAKEKGIPANLAAQYALGYVASLMEHRGRVDVHPGNPNTKRLFRLTPEAIQAQNDIRDLTSQQAITTIQERTNATISINQFNDPGNGNPVISYIVKE